MNKISTKIIMAIIVSSFVTVFSVGIISFVYSRNILREEAELNLYNLVTIEGQLINESLGEIRLLCDVLEVLTRENLDLNSVKNDYDAMQTFEDDILKTWTDTVEAFGLMSGWVVFDPHVIKGGHTMAVYESEGDLIREPEYDIREGGFETDEWYGSAVEYGEIWTKPYYWDLWGDVITYSQALEIDGEVVGVIGSEFFIDELSERLSNIKIYESGYVTLMDSDFNFLFHPTEQAGNLQALEGGNLTHVADQIRDSEDIKGIIEYTYQDQKKIMAYFILDNGWILTANPVVSEFYTNVNEMMRGILIVSLIAIVIALSLAILLGRRIARPLEALTKRTVDLANGVYDSQESFMKSHVYEIDVLQTNFQVMFESIQDREEELKQFVYVASHDLQEPLRMVTSYLQIIEKKYKGKLDEKADTYIYYAVDGAKRMKILIKDLLLYSRAANEIEYTEIDLNQVVREVLNNLAGSIKDTNIQIKVDELPSVLSEHTRMVQLFQNLVSNAIKYRTGTSPIVTIKAVKQEDQWEIIVKDNGIGFNQENADLIFEVFKRLHNKEEYPGSGIGLSICKKIMEKHKGDIYAISSKNAGAAFHMLFPIHKEDII